MNDNAQQSEYSELRAQCLEQYRNKRNSITPYRHPPKPERAVTGERYTSCGGDKRLTIGDVIFPNKSSAADCDGRIDGVGGQLNRMYTGNFDSAYRYGKWSKRTPIGACFQYPSVQDESSISKKQFNRPRLPEHIDNTTVFGEKSKKGFGIGDVIFPNTLPGNNDDGTELYKISHRAYGTGERLNRKYTASFDPDYRYGKRLKLLPGGVWFKCNVNSERSPSADDKNANFGRFLNSLLERVEDDECIRYPYVDKRQGKFPGRQHFNAAETMTGSYPDEKEFRFKECLSMINKIKYAVKKSKHNIWELREAYKTLDQQGTGWLPIEQVYELCYRHRIRPEKDIFNLALNSVRAIDDKNNNVRYDLFVDLIDPNVRFCPSFRTAAKTENDDRFVSTYENEYKDKLSRSVPLNEKPDYYDGPSRATVDTRRDFCFGAETNVKTLLSPSVYSNYGLTYRDFYKGRSKDVMEKLFRDVGVNLPSEIFNLIWENAYRCGGADDMVSVEVFRQALQELAERTLTTVTGRGQQ